MEVVEFRVEGGRTRLLRRKVKNAGFGQLMFFLVWDVLDSGKDLTSSILTTEQCSKIT